jgi:hypothetical protein
MTKKYFTRLLQTSLMCCLAVLFTACDDYFGSESNPTPAYLTMSDKPVTIKVGETFLRQATAATVVIEYSSSDTKVATVDNTGLVTAIAEGETTITATATGYSSQTGKKIYLPDSKSYKLTVKSASVAVTGVTLDKAVLRIAKSTTTETLTATVSPAEATDKTVTWKSSDENVATVDASGKITPKKAGTVTIEATAGDKTATSTVYVYDKIVDINAGVATVTGGESWLINGNGTKVANGIIIGTDATVTLNGINITQQIDCLADATIILADGSENKVTVSTNELAGIQIGIAGTFTINAETAGTGRLNATGGSGAAGIGTSKDETGGNIVINGGTVTATGGNGGAGIGTGNADTSTNTCGTITINGGTVTATSDGGGAGIGTGIAYMGQTNTCDAITINGGTVTATGGGSAAGIGTGLAFGATNTCGAITIGTGVTSVTATKGTDSPNSIGIGGAVTGGTQNCGTITIGGVVKDQNDFTDATYTYTPAN